MFKKRGQITLFIILGVLTLVVFLVLMQVSSQIKKANLDKEKASVYQKVFEKEGFRLFIEDCIEDELQGGLELIGKQGRIWKGQPGGTMEFIDGINGKEIPGENDGKVAYGITKNNYADFGHPEEAYPCKSNLDQEPHFCKYTYPNTNLNFGKRTILTLGTIQKDLGNYLVTKVMECVHEFKGEDIPENFEFEDEDFEIEVSFSSEGIGVDLFYPINFEVEGEEIFALSEFSTFHPTKFVNFLEATVIQPRRHDVTYVDFSYNAEQLNDPDNRFFYGRVNDISSEDPPGNKIVECQQYSPSPDDKKYYVCDKSISSHSGLQFNLDIIEIDPDTGDELYTFTSTDDELFRFIRQDRPPALDYISRSECTDESDPDKQYDYLVIKEGENDDPILEKYYEIDIKPNATDPDEEDILRYDYEFENYFLPSVSESGEKISESSQPPPRLYFNSEKIEDIEEGIHKIKVKAIGQHDKEDSQTVRVLIDRPATTKLEVKLPYTQIDHKMGPDTYAISREDPFFLNVVWPKESELNGLDQEIKLIYYQDRTNDYPTSEKLSSDPPFYSNDGCYSFPKGEQSNPDCQNPQILNDYLIEGIIPNSPDFLKFDQSTPLDKRHKLSLNFETQYCENVDVGSSTHFDFAVKECIPYIDTNHPIPYMYEEPSTTLEESKLYQKDSNGNVDSDLSPFLASHNCCKGGNPQSWKLEKNKKVCFSDEIPGCYTNEYVLEERERHCGDMSSPDSKAERGNICGGDWSYKLHKNNGKIQCGSWETNGNPNNCPNNPATINEECQGKDSWGYVDKDGDDNNEGWCHGTFGCSEFCKKGESPVVMENIVKGPKNPLKSAEQIGILFQDDKGLKEITKNDNNIEYHCGCKVSDIDAQYVCDNNHDGDFTGNCVRDGHNIVCDES